MPFSKRNVSMKIKHVPLAQQLIADVTALLWAMASTPLYMGSVPAMPHLRLRSVSSVIFSGSGLLIHAASGNGSGPITP